MAGTTANLELDVALIGGGETLRQALASNFEKIDASVGVTTGLPAHGPGDEGKILKIVDGAPAWVDPT